MRSRILLYTVESWIKANRSKIFPSTKVDILMLWKRQYINTECVYCETLHKDNSFCLYVSFFSSENTSIVFFKGFDIFLSCLNLINTKCDALCCTTIHSNIVFSTLYTWNRKEAMYITLPYWLSNFHLSFRYKLTKCPSK